MNGERNLKQKGQRHGVWFEMMIFQESLVHVIKTQAMRKLPAVSSLQDTGKP